MDIYDLRDKYRALPPQEGVIRWFDGSSGEGEVSLDDGQRLYCHYSAIYGIDKNNHAYPTEQDRITLGCLGYNTTRVLVVPYITAGYIGCERVVLLNHVIGE